ncbi:hypothetical protein LTR96_010863 [Exophiala xenobiotica]|nr:hypothetical protein LTR92_011137 [Exophiala xenobiotica]KAK5215929.1 hypothetical protein LTR72_011054 [Exophiala xenobiotica]KAK5222321.1 hypothetical protein LTR47_010635 [Exophiala xenobiotica]KAK5246940.1 hypothetical protein LTS06_007859 [Exophiala xenobiotica]KAK5263728.1 hypothetical protein LTR96_010863 [Exophiala xenobiotica]
MTNNFPDERVVYLALKEFFKGADAQIRRAKKVREVVQKAQNNIDIFESTLKAKIRFPEVFEISPAQSAERSASEAEAARLEADALKSASGGQNNNAATGNSQDVHLFSDKASRTGWWLACNASSFES